MDNPLELLRELHTPEDLLTDTATFQKDTRGIYHGSISCKEIVGRSVNHTQHPVLVRVALCCPCTTQITDEHEAAQVILRSFDEMNISTSGPLDTYNKYEKILFYLLELEYLLGQTSRMTQALQETSEQLHAYAQEVAAELQSAPMRQDIINSSQALYPEMTGMVLVGVQGPKYQVYPVKLFRQIFGRRAESSDTFVLHLEAAVAHRLRPTTLLVVHTDRSGEIFHHNLERSDTSEVAELAMGLWDPTSSNDVQTLEGALKVARTLC